ncbi:MAG: DNA topoisomerase VI subunit B [Thermoplasmata archaeon]
MVYVRHVRYWRALEKTVDIVSTTPGSRKFIYAVVDSGEKMGCHVDSIAEKLAEKQKEISIGEFFERNKHILGFDSLTKSMVTAVKEGVDNSLDACEEADILPDITVEIEEVDDKEYRVAVEDNGPGIVKRNIPDVFAKLLYGARFHDVRQSRGQQGIGVSAVVMYGQLSTGRATTVRSKVKEKDYAVEMEITMDTKKNEGEIISQDVVLWDQKEHGTRFETTIKGLLRSGDHSIFEYLKNTAIVNPHAKITFDRDGETTVFKRATDKLPPPTIAVKPHIEGIELGTFVKMAKESKRRKLSSFLVNEFSRISYRTARQICDAAGVDENKGPGEVSLGECKKLLAAAGEVKIMAPETDCLSPIRSMLIKKGLKNVLKGYRPEFYAPPTTREPCVYSGNPFQVEVGLVYGGDLPSEGAVDVLRFANRVPLLYKKSGCATTTAIKNIDWRIYGLDQRGGRGMPSGPAIILVHVASTRVPFTSEAKEAIADIPEVVEEIERGLRECARYMRTHLNKEKRRKKVSRKFMIVRDILPMIAEKSAVIVGKDPPPLDKVMTKIMGVVYVESSHEWSKKHCSVSIDINNYTPRKRKLKMYMEKPYPDNAAMNAVPEPKYDGEYLEWELETLKPSGLAEIRFKFNGGLKKEDMEGLELYIEGVDGSKLIGAEPLPDDWNVEMAEIEKG